MCENDKLMNTIRYGEDTFEIYEESLTFQQAVDKCKCDAIPSRSLALVKTDDAFENLSQALAKSKTSMHYWKIGLKRVGDSLVWLDNDIAQNHPSYILKGSGNCYNIYVSKESAFLRPSPCDWRATVDDVFGYVCSHKNLMTPDASPTTSLQPRNDDAHLSSDTSSANNFNVPIVIAMAILLTCVIILATLLVIRKRRGRANSNTDRYSLNPVLGHENPAALESIMEFGRSGYQDDAGSAGYATIDDMQDMKKAEGGPAEENAYLEIGASENTRDVYAVVKKQKSVTEDNADAKNFRSDEQVTYAVVNKAKK